MTFVSAVLPENEARPLLKAQLIPANPSESGRNEAVGAGNQRESPAFTRRDCRSDDAESMRMVNGWTTWKRFPLIERGEPIEAPIGHGVYEVRRISSGD